MEKPREGVQPLERQEDESLADYVTRLYEATMGGVNSIQEALQRDPDNFARMVNNIPDMIKELKTQTVGDQGELPK